MTEYYDAYIHDGDTTEALKTFLSALKAIHVDIYRRGNVVYAYEELKIACNTLSVIIRCIETKDEEKRLKND